MSIDSPSEIEHLSIADVALNYPQAIRILNRYGLDYSCNGKISFVEACEVQNLNPYHVWQEIEDEIRMTGRNRRREFGSWETDLLIDFILQHHHEYLRLTIPQIRELLNTVCIHHSDDSPVQEIKEHFEVVADDLLGHLSREENVLFPALRRLSRPLLPQTPILSDLQKAISSTKDRFHRAGDSIRAIRRLANDYAAPAKACPTFQLLYRLLEEFEYDVIQHIHLENNILFPKAAQASDN